MYKQTTNVTFITFSTSSFLIGLFQLGYRLKLYDLIQKLIAPANF